MATFEKEKFNMRNYFYYRDKKQISPVANAETNKKAKKKLDQIFIENKNKIPDYFLENWDSVSLYNSAGDINKANAILINPEEGAYDLANPLNDLTGKEWIKFTCSWFIFNALQKDLKEERQISKSTQDHPATFSPTMVEDFIRFFTKKGEAVLDPFCGIGSTLVACNRTGRIGYGIELNDKYYQISLKRAPKFGKNIFNENAENILKLNLPKISYSISSPPYWNVLNRSTKDFKNNRIKNGFDYKYSTEDNDLGNIKDYDIFLEKLAKIYFDIYDLLKNDAYLTIIVKNVKKEGKLYLLAWDLAKILSKKYLLKDEKIWIQDKVGLAPYGYPSSWASNILHHYCLIFQKK
ncbi:MAG: DNA methyltransferase [Candidatus Humimicrobiaceae bacterium]